MSLDLGWAVPWDTAAVLLCAGLWQLWQWSCPVWGHFGGSARRAVVCSAGVACCVILVPVGVRVGAAVVGCVPRC